MRAGVALIRSQCPYDNSVIFLTTHGPPESEDEYPCSSVSLSQFTDINVQIAMVVVGEENYDLDALNCTNRETAVYSYPSDIVHFNTTERFFRDLPSIQYTLGFPYIKSPFDQWYPNS